MPNKIKYGLKNAHWAKCTVAADGTATYETPEAWPGSVSLSMDAQGNVTIFRADNMDYWTAASNNGYQGDFESALVPDSFREYALGEYVDTNDLHVEEVTGTSNYFAFMFQFEGDVNNTRHVLYKCTAARPSVAGQTTEAKEITPATESLQFTAGAIHIAALDKDVVKARCYEGDSKYDTFFETVTLPTAAKP